MRDQANQPKANLFVKTKLILGFAMLFTLNLGYHIYTSYSFKKITETVDYTYDRALMTAYFAQSSKAHFARCLQFSDLILHARNPGQAEEARKVALQEYDNFLSDLGVVLERTVDTEMNEQLKQIQDDAKELGNQLKERAILAHDQEELRFGFHERLHKALSAVADHASEVGYRQRLKAEDQSKAVLRATYGFVGFIILFNFVVGTWISLTIFRPLRKLEEACREIGAGKKDFRAPVFARDEFGSVAIAFNSMLDQLREKEKQMEELVRELSHKQAEIEVQLKAAYAIQQSLLPPLKQDFAGIRIEALYQPCDALSGDFFDTILSEEWVYVYLADVTSHGMASAQVTYLIKESFRQILAHNPDINLGELFERVRESYVRHNLEYDVGLLLVRINASSRQIEIIRSNAPDPILIEGHKGALISTEVSRLISATSGSDDGAVFIYSNEIKPGQFLYIYTDGAFEFESKAGREFGQRRLIAAVCSSHDQAWPESLVSSLNRESRLPKFKDDVTIVRMGLMEAGE